MTNEIAVKVHKITEDGLPDMESLIGRVAFLFDGCIVSGWPLDPNGEAGDAYRRYGHDPADSILWEANSDVGHGRPFGGVTHWYEFPYPLWATR